MSSGEGACVRARRPGRDWGGFISYRHRSRYPDEFFPKPWPAAGCTRISRRHARGNARVRFESPLGFLPAPFPAGHSTCAWPFFLVSPNGQAQPFSGQALAGVVLTTGEFAIWSELAQAAFEKPSERRQLRILAGTNPIASGKTLQANQRLTTPAMVYTYTDQGVQSVSIRFREWAERYCAGSNSDLRFLLASLPTW